MMYRMQVLKGSLFINIMWFVVKYDILYSITFEFELDASIKLSRLKSHTIYMWEVINLNMHGHMIIKMESRLLKIRE